MCDPRPRILGRATAEVCVLYTNSDRVSDAQRRVNLFRRISLTITALSPTFNCTGWFIDAQTHAKSECLTQPGGRLIHIWIRQHGLRWREVSIGSACERVVGIPDSCHRGPETAFWEITPDKSAWLR